MMNRAVVAVVAFVALHCASAVPPKDDLGARVDAVFRELVAPGAPGCAVGIARGGKTILERAYGQAHLDHDVPLTPATIFEAGSVAKQFAAAAVVMLAVDGKLALDDPARKYLPELDRSAEAVTVRQLLSHTSGLRDFGAVLDVAGWPRGTRALTHDDVLEITSRQRALNFPPGSQYTYNTGAYNLLAVIAERVSGESLPALTESRIFAPLGMTSSSWRDDYQEVVKGRAASYLKRGDAFVTAVDVESIYGNCCLRTTVGDLLRWNANLASPNGIGRSALDLMQTPFTLSDGRRIDYGLGVRVDDTPGRRHISHTGSTAGYRASLAHYPDEDLSIALLCNRSDGLSIADRLLAAVRNVPPPAPAVATPASEGAELIGLWLDRKTDAIIVIDGAEGRLRMRPRAAGGGASLVRVDRNRYRVGRHELRLEADELHLLSVYKPEAVYARVPRVAADAVALAEYAGVYASDEAEARWTVSVEGGKLVARPRRSVRIALEPTYADGFITSGDDLVRFTRDENGRVDGFDVKTQFSMTDGSARLERLHFTRVTSDGALP